MPLIKSAKKKLRIDRRKESSNKKIENLVRLSIKKAGKKPTPKSIQEAFKIIDKGAKKNIIHKNKASRIKSRLSKLLNKNKKTLSPTKVKSGLSKTKRAKKKTS
ncbi:MAG: 30S ribosomal protein S20 [Candidatus Levybacteria bacterium]|nr:30S ribosomal protein S20 [Candidatus Levybacteria bacterium]